MIKESRKQEIIRIAAKLFREKGYTAVTMRDLASSMGIKAASLYNHIDSKQEILREIIISIAEEFTDGMSSILNEESTSIQKLNKIIELHVSLARINPDGMAALNSDWMHLDAKRSYYISLRDSYEANIRNIINEGILAGELIDENVEVMLFSILSTLRFLYLWMPKKEDIKASELTQSLSRILIMGINK